jgi:hypothetical protein
MNATVLEVCNIAGRELGPSHLGDGCDLRISVADRSAEGAAVSGNLGKSSRCVAVEPEDAAAKSSANIASAAASNPSRRWPLVSRSTP